MLSNENELKIKFSNYLFVQNGRKGHGSNSEFWRAHEMFDSPLCPTIAAQISLFPFRNMSLFSRRLLFAVQKTPSRAYSSKSTPPVPKPTSDPSDTAIPAYEVNFVPPGLRSRSTRIYSPAKTAMSSGVNNTGYWLLDFDSQTKWENPVMGWTSTADPVQALQLKFATKEDAIAFAEKQGYDYWIEYVSSLYN